MISLFGALKKDGVFGDCSFNMITKLIIPLFDFKYAESTVCKMMKLYDKYSDHYIDIQAFINKIKNII